MIFPGMSGRLVRGFPKGAMFEQRGSQHCSLKSSCRGLNLLDPVVALPFFSVEAPASFCLLCLERSPLQKKMLGISWFLLHRSSESQSSLARPPYAKHLHCCWSSCHTPFLLRTSPKFDCCLHHVLSQLLVVVTPLFLFPSAGDWQPPAL